MRTGANGLRRCEKHLLENGRLLDTTHCSCVRQKDSPELTSAERFWIVNADALSTLDDSMMPSSFRAMLPELPGEGSNFRKPRLVQVRKTYNEFLPQEDT